jgi:hypothetical protein
MAHRGWSMSELALDFVHHKRVFFASLFLIVFRFYLSLLSNFIVYFFSESAQAGALRERRQPL